MHFKLISILYVARQTFSKEAFHCIKDTTFLHLKYHQVGVKSSTQPVHPGNLEQPGKTEGTEGLWVRGFLPYSPPLTLTHTRYQLRHLLAQLSPKDWTSAAQSKTTTDHRSRDQGYLTAGVHGEPGSQEPGARSQEPGARSREPGARTPGDGGRSGKGEQ